VLLATGLLLALYCAGTGMLGREAGILAVLAAAATVLFQKHARLAETDMALTLFTALASWGCFLALGSRKPLGRWALAGLCAGLGFMAKGPAAVAVPLLAVLTYVAWSRSRCAPRHPWLGALAALAVLLMVVLPWYAFVWKVQAADSVVAEELGRIIRSGDHPGPWYYYLLRTPVLLLPWGVLLPFALYHAWVKSRTHAGVRFVLGWFCSSLALLSVLHNKQHHYALLLLPPAGLLLAALLHDGFAGLGRARWMKIGAAVLLLSVAGTQGYLFFGHRWHEPKSLIQDFMRRSETSFPAGYGPVYFVGTGKEVCDFYSGRVLQHMPDLKTAWQDMPGGATLIAVANRDLPVDPGTIPATPALDLSRGEIRCLLFVKQ
jgi:4-amino-4-deoxy-L-arabinose transferase-like glycosyltransferase